jgi:hypothetical protein
MGKFRKRITSLLTLCISFVFCHILQASESGAQGWSSFEIEHNRIRVVSIHSSNLSPIEVQNLKKAVVSSLEFVENKNQGNFESSFEILFDHRPAFHNGLATAIPRNFILIHTVAPQNNSSIGVSADYIKSTLIHEMAHIFYLQKRRGIFQAGGWLFGNLSTPLGAWPRWMHEGWATWTEGRFSAQQNLGYLNFLKRSYAEYVSRYPQFRLSNSMLEGSSPLRMISSGEIPYAFGNTMLEKVFSQLSPNQWAESSASSLGISFRKSAKRNGLSFDQVFEESELEWRREHVSVPQNKFGNLLMRGATIDSMSDHLAIKRHDEKTTIVDFTSHQEPRSIEWKNHNWFLSAVGPSSASSKIYAAYYSPSRKGNGGTRLRISLFEVSSSMLIHNCTVLDTEEYSVAKLGKSPNGETFALLRPRKISTEALTQPLHLPISSDCALKKTTSVPQSAQKLKTHGFDTQVWKLRDTDSQTWDFDNLINPSEVPQEICNDIFGHQGTACLSAVYSSATFRNPSLISKSRAGRWFIKSINTATGAQDFQVTKSGLVWIERFWEEDRLYTASIEELKKQPQQEFLEASRGVEASVPARQNDTNDVNQKKYRASSTLWPHYWMPRIYASQNGAIVSGTTWFHDITKTYEGTLDLGYDTVSKAPYAQTSIQRKMGGVHWPQSVDLSFAYHRDTTLGFNIDQGLMRLGFSSSTALNGSTNLSPRISVSGKWTSINGNQSYFLIPLTSLTLQYRNATRPTSLNVDHSQHDFGVLLYARASWVNSYETFAEASFSHSWPMSWVLHAEYGKTSRENLPFSYFEWGGAYPISLIQTSFLSRGFAPRSAASTHIARLALTTGWTWTDRIGGLGWSRFEVERISQDLIAETVSYESLRANGPSIAENYFSTLGTEVNFWIRSLFYLKSRAYLGVYQGFGINAETRFGVGLASNLDI